MTKVNDDEKDTSIKLDRMEGDIAPGEIVKINVTYTSQIAGVRSFTQFKVAAFGGNDVDCKNIDGPRVCSRKVAEKESCRSCLYCCYCCCSSIEEEEKEKKNSTDGGRSAKISRLSAQAEDDVFSCSCFSGAAIILTCLLGPILGLPNAVWQLTGHQREDPGVRLTLVYVSTLLSLHCRDSNLC